MFGDASLSEVPFSTAEIIEAFFNGERFFFDVTVDKTLMFQLSVLY
jgi:hypothetical protein